MDRAALMRSPGVPQGGIRLQRDDRVAPREFDLGNDFVCGLLPPRHWQAATKSDVLCTGCAVCRVEGGAAVHPEGNVSVDARPARGGSRRGATLGIDNQEQLEPPPVLLPKFGTHLGEERRRHLETNGYNSASSVGASSIGASSLDASSPTTSSPTAANGECVDHPSPFDTLSLFRTPNNCEQG
eukprot:2921679-Prymnesium_polylepis.1